MYKKKPPRNSKYSYRENIVENYIKPKLNQNTKGYVYTAHFGYSTYTLTRLEYLGKTHRRGITLRLPSGREILFYGVHLYPLPDGDYLSKKYSDSEIIRRSKYTGDYEGVFRNPDLDGDI